MMDVVFLVEDGTSASARTRASDLVAGLEREGFRARVEPLAKGTSARKKQLEAIRGASAVVLARKLLAERDLVRLRRAARALVFDMDDAVSERPFDVRDRGPSWSRPRRFDETLRVADSVVSGSAWLRDLARKLHPRVRLLPVAVEPPAKVPSHRSRGDGMKGETVTLLWSGSRATLPYLERLKGPLSALSRRRPRTELLVLCDHAPGELGIPTRFLRFSLDEEEKALSRADIGLHPLGEDPWSRGKCGLKLARYLSFGVPAVSSRFGAGAELVDAPFTGLLADDEGEWLSSLDALVSDPERRRSMGTRARADAAARFSLEGRVRAWASVLKEAAAIGERRSLAR